jgi:hypothetical protein
MTDIASIKEDFVRFRARLSSADAALVNPFLERLSAWRDDNSTIADLVGDLDRVLGQSWFSSNDHHAAVVSVIGRLRDSVYSIGGMTMNERLYVFGLMDRWDRAATLERTALYKKVMASEHA